MQDSVLETLLVVDYTIKISEKNYRISLPNLTPKLKIAENWETQNGIS
jgi:hypothetical protein